MPQIWLTYDELGDVLACGAARAVEQARLSGWARRRCRDGLSRVKLPPDMTGLVLRDLASEPSAEARVDRMVAALRSLLTESKAPPSRRSAA